MSPRSAQKFTSVTHYAPQTSPWRMRKLITTTSACALLSTLSLPLRAQTPPPQPLPDNPLRASQPLRPSQPPAPAAPTIPAAPSASRVKVAGRAPSSAFRPIGSRRTTQSQPTGSQPLPNQPLTAQTSDVRPAYLLGGTISPARQTAYMQGGGYSMPGLDAGGLDPAPSVPPVQSGAPPLQSNGGRNQIPPTTLPPDAGLGNAPSLPSNVDPRNLRSVPQARSIPGGQPAARPQANTASPSDLDPLAQPQLQSGWATAANCRLVTPPSGYSASFWYDGCGVPVVPAGANPASVPYAVVPATTMPNAPASMAVQGRPVGWQPIISLGQERNNVQLGRGIIGQPVAYVPGQFFRNFLRYIFP